MTWSLGEVRWRGRCEVLELDEKVATLHFLALNVELIVLAQKQASSTRVKVEVRFLRAGHRNENGTLREWGASLRGSRACHLISCAPLFFRSSTSRFEVCVLHPFAPFVFTEAVDPRTEARVFQLEAFSAFLRGVSQAPLPDLLKPSPAMQMYDVYCKLASYGSYVSGLGYLRGYAVFFWPTHLDEFAYHRRLKLCKDP